MMTTKMLAKLPHSSGASNQARASSWLNALNFSWKKNTPQSHLSAPLATFYICRLPISIFAVPPLASLLSCVSAFPLCPCLEASGSRARDAHNFKIVYRNPRSYSPSSSSVSRVTTVIPCHVVCSPFSVTILKFLADGEIDMRGNEMIGSEFGNAFGAPLNAP